MSRAILFPTIQVLIMGLAFKDLIQFRPLELPLSLMVQAGGLMIEATDQSNAKRVEVDLDSHLLREFLCFAFASHSPASIFRDMPPRTLASHHPGE